MSAKDDRRLIPARFRIAACLLLGSFAASPFVGVAAAQGADATTELITILGDGQAAARAAPLVRVFQRPGCGSAANNFLCFSLTQTAASPSFSTYRSTPALTFNAPRPGRAVVTWQGTGYCTGDTIFTSFDPPRTEWDIVLNVQLQEGTGGGIPYNAPGASSLGENRQADMVRSYYLMTPLTLTRSFTIPAAGQKRYFLRARAEFRASIISGAFCNINGGSMTAIFVGQ